MGKTKVKTILCSFLLAAVAVCLSVAFVACKGGDKDKSAGKYGAGEEGIYYYDKDADTEYLMTLQSGVYMISMDGASGYSGTYSYDDETKLVSFVASDGDEFEASFTDDVMQLAIAGTPYTFLKKVDYAVRFMDGASTVGTQSVTYGKNASKIDAEKDGYIFVGWYEDAAFTTQYGFNTAVTGDVTLYARYVKIDSTIANFDVTFVMDGVAVYETKTQNGVVYDMYDAEGVLGWWVSDTNSEDALTYRYNGEVLTESVKLFAVGEGSLGASIYDDRITWEGSASSVTVTIEGMEPFTATGNPYYYDFSALSTGTYNITVEAQGYGEEELVYVSNALSRVSIFSVYGTTLVYNAVENAQYYKVSVTCGNPSHDHEMVYNGNTLTYDFSNCEMGKDGISFTVYAYALGYVESVSDIFVYALILDGTTIEIDSDTASWTAVAGATAYEVYVDDVLTATVAGTEYSFKYEEKGAEFTVAVRPVAPGYYSEKSDSVLYKKTTLKTPEITSVSNYEISWEKINEAVGYELNINGYLIAVKPADEGNDVPTSYLLSDTDKENISDVNMNAISVMAIAEDSSENSQYGDIMYMTGTVMSPALSYADGVISWQYALAAESYIIEYDGIKDTVTGVNTYDITFTHSGETQVSVYFMLGEEESAYAEIRVTTYAVIFDSRGGTAVDTIYVAKGDTLNLVELTSSDYEIGTADFSGWYTLPDLTGDYDKLTYGGDGNKISSGDVFDCNSTLVLYAFWTRQRIDVSLQAGTYGQYVDEETGEIISSVVEGVPYGSDTYTIPTSVCTDGAMFFLGYFSEPNGQGTQYTDATGKLIVRFNNIYVTTLYAGYGEQVKLKTTTYNGQAVLEVSKGDDIDLVPGGEVTVPATYTVGGTEYTVAVIGSSAFNKCKNLVTLNIPDTIMYVSTVNNGYAKGNGAFAECDALEKVCVYATGDENDVKEVTYYSDDAGLLYEKTSAGGVELIYYPYGKTSAYVAISETVSNENEYEIVGVSYEKVTRNVVSIGIQVFASNPYIASVTIPATVETISSQAFSSCTELATVTFASSSDGGSTPLTIDAKAFEKCTALTSVTLPSRLTSLDVKAFSGCTALEAIDVAAGGTYSSSNGIVCSGTTVILCPEGKAGEITIPSGMTTVGANAFEDCKLITKIEIPEYVATVCESAFSGCTGMEDVTFGGDENAAVKLEIQTQAFYNCSALTEVYLPQRLEKLAAYSFGKTSKLTTVHYDSWVGAAVDDLAGLEDYAFGTVPGSSGTMTFYLTTLYLGANVPEISFGSIFGGSKLTSVIIDPENPNFVSEEDTGVVFDKDQKTLIFYPAAREGEYVIPDGVTTIPANTFNARSYLTAITVPASVEYIGDFAFYNCTRLVTVTFVPAEDPETAEGLILGENVFRSCSALETVVFPERTIEIGDYVFYSCSSLKSVTLPASLKRFGTYNSMGNLTSVENAFYNCSSLEEIIVADGNDLFSTVGGILYLNKLNGSTGEYEASELIMAPRQLATEYSDVVVPLTVSKIWDKAFYNNKNITSFTMEGEAVYGLELGEQIFYSASNLATAVLPEGLKSIPYYTFAYCSALTEVTVPYTVTSISKGAFVSTKALETVTFEELPEGATEAQYALEFEDGANGTGTFQSSGIKTLIIPDRTTKIAAYMCYNCTSLKTLVIGKNVTKIPEWAFYYTKALKSLEFAGGDESKVESIGDYAFYEVFYETHGTQTLVLPAGVKSIGSYAFNYAYGLKAVVLNDGLEEIGQYAFNYCRYLEAITIPASVSSIGADAFNYCTSLSSLEFAEAKDGTETASSLEIGNSAFSSCTGLKEVVLPSYTTTLGTYVFNVCSSLASVTFALDEETQQASVTKIDNQCFSRTVITEFTFPETGKDITLGTAIFKNCKYLTTIHISSTMTSINNVFTNCYSITTVDIAEGNQNFVVDGAEPIVYSVSKGTIVFVYGELSGDVVISDVVTKIDTGAFQGQNTMTSIEIPNSVSQIDDSAFIGCTNLKSVVFYQGASAKAESLTLGKYAFMDCPCLTTFGASGTETGLVDLTSVVSLGNYAFAECSAIESVKFPESNPTTLGMYLFSECTSLVNIDFGGVTSTLGNYTFNGCSSLVSIAFPEGSTTTGTYVCDGCTSLKNITFPSTMTTTGNYAFLGCTGLEEVKIGDAMTTTGTYAFQNCTGLKKVDFGGMTSIANYTFDGCSSLEEAIFPEGMTTIGTYAFRYCYSLKKVEFSDTLTSAGNYSFRGCTSLEYVNLDNISSMGTYMFMDCSSLTTVVLGGCVKIAANAFQNCVSLTTVAATEAALVEGYADFSSLTSTGNYAFDGTGVQKIMMPQSLSTSSSTTGYVGTYIFRNCVNLVEVSFPEGTGVIDNYCFQNCTSLKSIVIPAGVTQLGTALNTSYIFDGCTALESVIFEGSGTITRIGGYTFRDCVSLESIDIPWDTTAKNLYVGNYAFQNTGIEEFEILSLMSGTSYIGTYAFSGCKNLKNVTFEEGFSTLNTYVFEGCTSLEEVYLPESLGVIAEGTFYGCTALTYVKLDNISTIDKYAFYGCSGLTDIELLENIGTVGEGAFEYCTGLTSIDLTYIAEVPDYAFYGCSKLAKVIIGEETVSIGHEAFAGCASLETFDLSPNNANYMLEEGILYTQDYVIVAVPSAKTGEVIVPEGGSVGAYAFAGTGITSVVLPEGTTEIAAYAFADSGVEEVTIPAGVETIGQYAFANSAIKSVVIPDSVTEMGAYAFYQTWNLEDVTLGSGIEEIATYAFSESGVTSVTIPSNVTAIGTYAFYGSTRALDVTFEEGLVSIGDYAFKESGILEANLPDSLTTLGTRVFESCELLESVIFGEGVTEIPDGSGTGYAGMFTGCTSLSNVDLGGHVTYLGIGAFVGCTALEEIDLTGVETFKDYTFYQSGLVSVFIPATVKMTTWSFRECENLEYVEFEEGFTDGWSSAAYCFAYCPKLKTVKLPSTITAMGGNDGFEGDTGLESIIIPANAGGFGDKMFGLWTEEQKVYFEASYYEATHNCATLSTSKGWSYLEANSDAQFFYYLEKPDDTSGLCDYGLNYWYYDANGNIVEWTVA